MKLGINQLTAPLKLLILIRPDDKETLSRAMQLASCCWGGIYMPIFPLYQNLPTDYRREYQINLSTEAYYQNLIANYDPDAILFDQDLDQETILTISGSLKVMTVESLLEGMRNGRNEYSIGLYELAVYLRDHEFKYTRADGAKFALPVFKENCLLLDAVFCRIPDDEHQRIKRIFTGNDALCEPELTWAAAVEYRNLLKMDVRESITYQLMPYGKRADQLGAAIYPMRRNRLRDVMNYWNLRASGWQVLPIPMDLLDADYFHRAVQQFTSERLSNYGSQSPFAITLLAAQGISHRLSRTALEKTIAVYQNGQNMPQYSYQHWFPRNWSGYEILKADHIKAIMFVQHADFEHHDSEETYARIPIRTVGLEWEGNVSREASHKVILRWNLYDEQGEYAELLSGIDQDQFTRLVGSMTFRNMRLSPVGIHQPLRKSDRDVTLLLPRSEPFFRAYFSKLKHKLNETSNSKLASEVLRNIGGIRGAKFFLRPGILKVIELFEGGRIIAYATLIAAIKKNARLENMSEKRFIAQLLEHKIIEIGAEIQCAVCNQHGFHLPAQMNIELTCPICRNPFAMPQSDPSGIVWAYRGIGPFTRNNKADGVMAVFAVLGLFTDEFSGIDCQQSALIGFELSMAEGENIEKKEVDLGILINDQYDMLTQPDLLLCECKTYKRFVQKDIERMITLGESFPGAVLTLATLNDTLDEIEIELVGKLVEHFQTGNRNRPRNPILILTGKELLPEQYFGNLDHFEQDLKPYHRHNDYLGALCELSVRKNLKVENWWDRGNRLWRESIERRKMVGHILQGLLDRPSRLLLGSGLPPTPPV
ncbi:hypothetical protein QWY86_03235 [Pedobacter aquatilis]|uniref:hypothetical protein n=1 Tax=Pedobacter aquatilis TaxID=351343 RepID=UPI0025B4A833|nr:hypothetical protein [Pedobacter aquatilis]MDN3585665.1 hypothetical protein [Pedobacter aquatilis]